MKKLLLFSFSVIIGVLFSLSSWGQIYESFESGLPTSYTATTSYSLSSGTWTGSANQVIRGSSGVESGSYSCQLRSQTGSQIITPTLSGGVGQISFYITASTTSGAYQVNLSTDNGSTWSPAPGSPFTISTTKTLRTIIVNNPSVNKIQIYRTGATLYIDDFATTTTGSSNDTDSKASAPTGGQVSGTNISSLTDTDAEAVNVFKFDIDDLSTADTEDTKVTNIRVKPHTTNTADWTDNIQGVKLDDGSSVTIGTPTITDTYIDIPITSGNLDIGDGSSSTITMSIYLNTSNISDGDVLSFMIDADDNGFTADNAGSTFASTFTGGDVTSNNFTISVAATQLSYTSGPPATGAPNTNFSVEVSATDENGNIDTDATHSITLTGESGSGTLSSATGLTQSLSSGSYSWTDCQFDIADTYQVTATTTGLTDNDVTSGDIIIAISADYIIISEMCDPDNNFRDDRYIEIYNPTSSTIDLTGCSVKAYTNGGTLTFTWNLSGTIASCTAMTCGDDASTISHDFSSATWTTSNTSWNGGVDDGARFYNSSATIIDEVSQPASNAYANSTIIRNSNISTPNTTYTSSEWTVTAVSDAGSGASTPGTHTCDACGNDNDSEASAPTGGQVSGTNISSLTDTDAEAINVFKFDIDDLSTADTEDTKVTNIRIKPHTTNTADWTNNIQGVKLSDGSAITIGSPTITDTYIDIPITSGNLDISDGGSSTITMSIYLNTSNISDGDILSFMIDADDNGFTADNSGSTFAPTFTGGDITSNEFTIVVTATELLFVQQPSNTYVNNSMSSDPTVEAVDANGNRDIDYSTGISVTSSGTMTGDPVSGTWSNGLASFSSITHTATGTNLTLTASSGSFSDETSSTFDITEAPALIISEVADPGDDVDGRFVELYNAGSTTIDFDSEDWWLMKHVNEGSSHPEIQLTGSIAAGSTYVIVGSSNFNTLYSPITYDLLASSVVTGNGDDGYHLYKDGSYASGTGTLVDIYGELDIDGTGEDWDYEDSRAERSCSASPNTTWTSSEWTITAANVADCEPHQRNCGPTITLSVSSLSDFMYSVGSGPSTEQSFTVTGTNLTNDISIDAPNNYEISTGTGGSFSATDPIVLTQSGGNVAETTIYVRLKSGLSATDYNGETITASSTGATDKTVTCNGTVCGTPSGEATSFIFSNIDVDQMDISWTSGGGESRIVLASTSPITVDPSNNTTYSASSVFGSGDDLGGGVYVIYNWTGNSLTLTGLSSSTTYYFKIFEYNCSSGHENYLTTSPLGDNETTLTQMVPVEDLDVTCETTSTATIEWSDPTAGDYDGVVITIRRGSNSPVVLPDAPSALTASTTFGNASSQYGSNPDYSYIVYKGTGNSVTVTGLTEDEEYSIKAFSYYDDGYDNTNAVTTTSISSLNVDDVSSATATAGNTTATLQWTLPDLCYDEILIVGHAGSSVSATPSGDGTSYTTSATFGSGTDIGSSEYVVYLDNGTNTSVTGLTNGTTYYFTIFTRNGTEWSPGIEVSVTPSNVTYFNPGELLIVGFDSQIDGFASATDKIYLATLVDLLPNTEFLYVNSRFEAGAAADERTMEWHGGGDDPDADPGIVTITYNGATSIPAGSIISYEVDLSSAYNFEINGVPNSDFSSSYNGVVTNISVSSGDQLWILQGVFTDQGTYHTLNGNVLYGLTIVEDWVDLSSACDGNNSGSQRESRIHPDIECFNLDISGSVTYAFYKNGTAGTPGIPAHDATFRSILIDVMNPSNWNSGSGSSNLDITEDFCDCDDSNTSSAVGRSFCISSYSVDHQWIGDNDTDWFNCANWKGLHIPNEETDVLFDSDECFDDIELTTEDTAKCKNITFQGSGSYDFYAGGDSDKIIEIFGDINIDMNNSVVFDDSNSGTADGQLILHGDWINTVGDNGFKEGNSTVIFTDAQAQQITTSSGNETFDTLKIDKSAGNLTLNDNIEADYLNLTSGNINTGINRVYISNTATSAIANAATDSYINGNLRRDVSATGSYDFPVGTASNFELINIDLQSSTGLTYLDASFDSSVGTTEISSLNLTVNGTLLQEVLDGGFWTVTPNAGVTAVEYNAGLSLRGSSNAGTEPAQHTVIKRANSGDDWAIRGNHDNDDQSISGGVVYAYRTSFNTFSDFAIAKHKTNILPVELLEFSIKCNDYENKLYWTTASELNNDYFEIQRSYDTRNWTRVDKVKGAGNSNSITQYEFTDKLSTGKVYYRLKQVDYDGQFEYSEILLANCSNIAEPIIEVYPNPVLNIAKLKIENWNTDKLKIEIYDMLGKQVYNSQINLFDGYTEEKINLSKYNSGIYLIRISDGQTIENLRLEKQ